MKGALIFAFVVVAVTALPAQNGNMAPKDEQYRHHKLLQVTPVNQKQLAALQHIENDIPSADFWIDGNLHHQAIFRISPDYYNDVVDVLNGVDVQYKIVHHDVQELMDVPHPEVQSAPVQFIVDNTKYHRYSAIQSYLNTFKSQYPSLVPDVGSLSKMTWDGQHVSYITLSTNGGNTGKLAIFIECGIHAREWISPAVCLYFIDRVLGTYATDSTAKDLLDQFDWIIVPEANPDGYEYSHTNSRLWRKNRSTVCSSGTGVDLNRNFKAAWGTAGTSPSCSADTYPGTGPFSEPESENIRAKVDSIKDRLSAFISIHSYSQLILTPYGFNSSKPSNYAHIKAVSDGAAAALRSVHGKNFQVGTPPELLYEASGGSYDWAMLEAQVKYAVTYELRPSGNDIFVGFRLPANQIIPSGEEFWESIAHIAFNH